jgi:hypothetical protein
MAERFDVRLVVSLADALQRVGAVADSCRGLSLEAVDGREDSIDFGV